MCMAVTDSFRKERVRNSDFLVFMFLHESINLLDRLHGI